MIEQNRGHVATLFAEARDALTRIGARLVPSASHRSSAEESAEIGPPDDGDGEGDGNAVVDAAATSPDERRVIEELRARDGYAWQSELVEATGWSGGKVSRTLSSMESDGTVNRYRSGREKVVFVPGTEPDHLRRRKT